jgi:hypothetical protein
MSSIRSRIAEIYGDDVILFDGLDAAIIGVSTGLQAQDQVIYSREKIVEHFIAEGMTEEEACEWVSFNVEGAGIKNGPIVMSEIPDDDLD